MFGSSSKDTKTAASAITATGGELTCVIAKGTVIEGKFTSAENVRLDGTIIGEVRIEKKLVMGDSGFIQGNIHTATAAIKGKIKGDISATEMIHLLESAKIEGNIKAKTMSVDEGAAHSGSSQIGGK